MARTRKATPTIQDIADALGINKSTVSQGLSGKGTLSDAMRNRVLTAAREIGYRPHPLAQRLAQGTSSTLICLIGGMLDIGIGTTKLLMVQKELTSRSFEVPIYTDPIPESSDDAAAQAAAAQVHALCRQHPRAIVWAGQRIHPAVLTELEDYQAAGGILVSYDMPTPLKCDQVVFDREDNAYQAARHLLEHGHRALGITNTRSRAESKIPHPQTHRMRGFQRALAEFDAPFRQEWVFQNAPYEEGGEELAQRFLALEERPTGLCIVNDYVALAFMDEIIRAGIHVPEEVSIVSHDNQRIAAHCPVPLTSVAHPTDDIVRNVVALLAERLEGYDGPPRTVTVRGELFARRSVAAPAAA